MTANGGKALGVTSAAEDTTKRHTVAARKSAGGKATESVDSGGAKPAKAGAAKTTSTKKTSAKKTAAKAPAKKAPAKAAAKAPAKAAAKAPATKTSAKKTPAKKQAAKRPATKAATAKSARKAAPEQLAVRSGERPWTEAELAEAGTPWTDGPWTESMRGEEQTGISAFLRVGEEVFHTYSTYGRGIEEFHNGYCYLDLTALGRLGQPARPLCHLRVGAALAVCDQVLALGPRVDRVLERLDVELAVLAAELHQVERGEVAGGVVEEQVLRAVVHEDARGGEVLGDRFREVVDLRLSRGAERREGSRALDVLDRLPLGQCDR